MIRPRWKKVVADLKENRARSLLVVASIAIGVFAIGMISVTYVLISDSMVTTYSRANPANIEIITMDFDNELLKRLENIQGVEDVEAHRMIKLRVFNQETGWQKIKLYAIEDFNQKIGVLEPIEGLAVPEDKQIILTNRAFQELPVSIGEQVELQLQDGDIKPMTIVGSTHDWTLGVEEIFINKAVGFITQDTLPFLHQSDLFNTVQITVSGDRTDKEYIHSVLKSVEDKIEDSGRVVYDSDIRPGNIHPMDNYVTAILGILWLLGVLVLVLSGFLITNTLSSLMSQQMRQIGVMKLVGAQRGQIIGMYIMLVFIYGLIALAMAIPTGAFGGYSLSIFIVELLNSQMSNISPIPLIPWIVLAQTIVAILIPIAAALLPVIRGSRITVQKAISGSSMGMGMEYTWFDRWLESWKLIKGAGILAVRNTFRQKGRLAMTLAALALGGAIFIAVFNVQASLNEQVLTVAKLSGADVNLEFDQPYSISEISEIILNTPGTSYVEGWGKTNAILEYGDKEDSVLITAPPHDTKIIEPKTVEGRWLIAEDEYAIVCNESFLKILPDLDVGDQIELEIRGKKDMWTIVGFYTFVGVDELMAYTNYHTLAGNLNETNRAASFRIETIEHDKVYQQEMATLLNSTFQDLGFRVTSSKSVQADIDSTTELLNILITVLLALANLTAVVGSIGLAGTLSMNVMERTSEIGILRAVGSNNSIITRMVIVEGITVSTISYILGVILSFPITSVLGDVVHMAIFGTSAKYVLSPRGFGIWFVVVLVFSVFASLIPARSATKLTIREVLAYE
ncbi:MAG: FtsX-like permease family protein [Anaerolineaceae bacterium]|nr:FtsX-like permease family protein [Anaerolineaceae bacterium]